MCSKLSTLDSEIRLDFYEINSLTLTWPERGGFILNFYLLCDNIARLSNSMTTMTCKGYGNSKFDIIKCKSKWILNIFYSCFTHAKALDVSHHVMLWCWFSHDSDSETSEASPTNLFQSEHWVIMNLSRVYHDMSRTLSNIIERGCRREWKIDSSFWEHCVCCYF